MSEWGINLLFQGNNFLRLLAGLWVTIRISLVAMVFSIIFGILVGILMRSRRRATRLSMRIYLEFIRVMPQIVLLFVVYFEVAKVSGYNPSGELAAIFVFTLWGSAEVGDLVRGALDSIPRHQIESSRALGLNNLQIQRYVTLPQAIRQLIPGLVNLSTRMIKTTTLVTLIGVVEVLKVAQQIIDVHRFDYPDASFWIYATVFFLYFLICFVLSRFASYLEGKTH